MAILNPTTVTVDAILTTKGRELLARNDGSFKITQFSLADDEIDYTLYNPNHPSGSAFYGEAIENTPFGNITEYAVLYNNFIRLKTLPAEAGSAKGGWTISFNGPTKIIFPERATDENALNIKNNADLDSQKYRLGDDVYIMNSVRYVASDGWPYDTYKNGAPVRSLESGASQQAPYGIMEPTLNAIYGIYASSLNEYYKAS
jgi:hypothetical protein